MPKGLQTYTLGVSGRTCPERGLKCGAVTEEKGSPNVAVLFHGLGTRMEQKLQRRTAASKHRLHLLRQVLLLLRGLTPVAPRENPGSEPGTELLLSLILRLPAS